MYVAIVDQLSSEDVNYAKDQLGGIGEELPVF